MIRETSTAFVPAISAACSEREAGSTKTRKHSREGLSGTALSHLQVLMTSVFWHEQAAEWFQRELLEQESVWHWDRGENQRDGSRRSPAGSDGAEGCVELQDSIWHGLCGLLARRGTDQRDLLSFADSSTILALFGYTVAAGARDTPASRHVAGPAERSGDEAQVRGLAASKWRVKRRINCDPVDLSSVVLQR